MTVDDLKALDLTGARLCVYPRGTNEYYLYRYVREGTLEGNVLTILSDWVSQVARRGRSRRRAENRSLVLDLAEATLSRGRSGKIIEIWINGAQITIEPHALRAPPTEAQG